MLRRQREDVGRELQRHIHARVPKTRLVRPLILAPQREAQALPRPQQGADTENARVALQLDAFGVPPRGGCCRIQQGGIHRRDIHRGIAIKAAVEVAARRKQPVRELLFQMQGVRTLERGLLLVSGRHGHPRNAQLVETVVVLASGQVIPLAAEAVRDARVVHLIIHIELQDVDLLRDVLVGGINIVGLTPVADRPPLRRGFGAIPILILVAQHHTRPLRQGQPEVGPGPAGVQVEVPVQIEDRRREGRVVAATVVVVFAILRPAEPGEADVILLG